MLKKNNLTKKVQLATPFNAVGRLMELSIATHINRYQLSQDIILGRKVFDIFLKKICSHQLSDVIENRLVFQDNPHSLPSWEEYLEDANIIQPPPFNEQMEEYRWMIIHYQQCHDHPLRNPTDQDIISVMDYRDNMPNIVLNKLHDAIDKLQSSHREHIKTFNR